MNKKSYEIINITMPKELNKLLVKTTKHYGQSKSEFIRNILEAHFENIENRIIPLDKEIKFFGSVARADKEDSFFATRLTNLAPFTLLQEYLDLPETRIILAGNIDEAMPDLEKHNAICFGGPKQNEVVKEIFRLVENDCNFIFQKPSEPGNSKYQIFDKVTGYYYNSIPGDWQFSLPPTFTDYGLITRVRNPYNRDKVICILSGIHSMGTLAATRVATDPSLRKEVYEKLGSHEFFQCLAEIRLEDFVLRKPEIRICRPIGAEG
ncbi:MAG: ribbon-helix-helix domain-containing protein [Chloroflexi bacterium]|nr:ribbon-helix-helix domain-containing protein [Chloroflexota bacterium]